MDLPEALKGDTCRGQTPFLSIFVGTQQKPSNIPILERLYAAFDEVGRNNLTTLPTTNLGQNGAIYYAEAGS